MNTDFQTRLNIRRMLRQSAGRWIEPLPPPCLPPGYAETVAELAKSFAALPDVAVRDYRQSCREISIVLGAGRAALEAVRQHCTPHRAPTTDQIEQAIEQCRSLFPAHCELQEPEPEPADAILQFIHRLFDGLNGTVSF